MIIPKPLFEGARVAILGTSGPVPDEARLAKAVEAVKALGLEPVIYPSATMRHGYLSGTDKARADDLNAAFADKTIDGILGSRGGYGAPRILPLLDFKMIGKNPKYFSGYSDITALHIAINQLCNFVTYHTPMPSTELYKGIDDYSMGYVKDMLFGRSPAAYCNPEGTKMRTLVGGSASGILTGGNLSLVVSSIGTPYEIDTKGKILFIEDIGESPYRIDGMLTQLRNSGKLRDCAGIILGAYTDCIAEKPENSLSLQQVFDELIVPAGKPAIMDVVCGHCMPTMSLPLGKYFEINADTCTIEEA